MTFQQQLTRISLFALVFCMLLSATAFAQKFGKIQDEDWQEGPPADYPEANAIVLFDRATMNVKLDIIVMDFHVRIKVLTKAGIEEVAEQSFWFDEDLDKVKGFKAHTITPDGKKHKVEKDAIFDKEVRDWKVRSFTFPALEEGCIIEYKYQLKSKRFWYLAPRYFQSDIYTKMADLSVTMVPGFNFDVDYMNVPGRYRSPKESSAPNPDVSMGMQQIKTFTWKMENMPPIKDEPYMSSIDDYQATLRFQLISYTNRNGATSYFTKDWSQIGDDYLNIVNQYWNKRGDIEKLAEEVTAGATTPREKSQALYDYVASEIKTMDRYPNIWFKHDKMSEMLEEKLGEGEEKNFLLVKLHQALGLDCWPVLISTRDNGRFNPKFPSLSQYNYLIGLVQFGNEWEFLDVSAEHAPYGLLPPQCLTDGGLIIDKGNHGLVKIAIKSLESARSDYTRMFIGADGAVTCSTTCCFTGYYASAYGERYDRRDPQDFVEDFFLDRVDGNCTLVDHNCKLDSLHQFVAELDYTSDGFVRQLDNNVLVKPVYYAFVSNPFKSEKRFTPVDFTYPFNYENTVEILVEGDVAEFSLPEDLAFESGGLAFERKSVVVDSVVLVKSRMAVIDPLFKPMRYKALRSFFDKVALATEDEVAAVLKTAQ